MTLADLKVLMGIAADDTSQDAILQLYLDSALDAAKQFANGYDWTSTAELPGTIKLGILRYVELSQKRKSKSGVVSESIAGMTRTFNTSSSPGNDYFSEVYDFWLPYRSKGVTFIPARKKQAPSGRFIEIYDEGSQVIRVMTGNPEKL